MIHVPFVAAFTAFAPALRGLGKVFRDMGTGIDGESWDVARLSGIFLLTNFVAMGWHAEITRGLDFIGFGTGVAAVCGGVGAWILMKKDTEPKPEPPHAA